MRPSDLGWYCYVRIKIPGIRQSIRCAVGMVAVVVLASSVHADARQIATTVCLACHGPDGNSVVSAFPSLAGQQVAYLTKQLNEFMSGKRTNEAMAPALAELKPGDVPGLAVYYASQKPVPGKVEDEALVKKGEELYNDGNIDSGVPACIDCHQPAGAGNARFPRLAGQHQAYTLLQLANFKSGLRTNDRARVMRVVAERMTEDEMRAAAEYLASL